MKRIALFTILFALFGTIANATGKTRTTAQWAELCKHAVPARDLRTTRLISSKGVAPIRATLAAAGLSNFKEESVPDVLVAHDDGTCGRDNARLFYQITKRPHREANGQFVIGDYADGVAFVDPARRVPEGTMWGAKKVGVMVYLPVQFGECDRDLATCKGAYQSVVAERDALRKQLASGIVTPVSQSTTPVIPPTTPVVAGTVKPVSSSFKGRIGFLMIAAAVALGALYQRRRYSRRLNKAHGAHKQSHDDMHGTIVRLRTERNGARDSLANTAHARDALHDTLVSEREAVVALTRANGTQLEEIRKQRDIAERSLAALKAQIASAFRTIGYDSKSWTISEAIDDFVTRIRKECGEPESKTEPHLLVRATLRNLRAERDSYLREARGLATRLSNIAKALGGSINGISRSLKQHLAALASADSELLSLREEVVDLRSVDESLLQLRCDATEAFGKLGLKDPIPESTNEVERLCQQLKVFEGALGAKQTELALADRLAGIDEGPEDTFGRPNGMVLATVPAQPNDGLEIVAALLRRLADVLNPVALRPIVECIEHSGRKPTAARELVRRLTHLGAQARAAA